MTIAAQITDKAASLFDVTGVSQSSKGDKLLILGLESRPDRDLDEFGHLGGGFQLPGFKKHMGPRLETLLAFIHDRGFSADPVGRYGYPLERQINLKEEAIRTGLGRRGKSSVVLHPKFGPRLRFAAVTTDAPLEPVEDSGLPDKENPVCDQCSICVDACPVNILEAYRMTNPSPCLSNLSPVDKDGRSILCDLCLQMCPAARTA